MPILVIIITAAAFLAMITQLASNPSLSTTSVTAAVIAAAVTGFLFYGYAYAVTTDFIGVAVIRALLGVCGMYVGKVDTSTLSVPPFAGSNLWAVVFWFGHLCALYATASAAVRTIGAEALRRFRMWLLRTGDLVVIYGLTEETLTFGRTLGENKGVSILFIDEHPSESLVKNAAAWNGVVRSDGPALTPGSRFLKSIGMRPGSRDLSVYALTDNPSGNLKYAMSLRDALLEGGIRPEQTRLILSGQEAQTGSFLMNDGEHYGYGDVLVFDRPTLTARLLTELYPPASCMKFRDDGTAEGDFDCLLVGCGLVGQAVLKYLVMNGQFEGSTFHAAVFAPDSPQVTGALRSMTPELLRRYDISFVDEDARSDAMYRYLAEHREFLKYIVVTTGSDKLNNEIAMQILTYLRALGSTLPVYTCSRSSVTRLDDPSAPAVSDSVFSPAVLADPLKDQIAKALNHRYTGGPSTAEDWKNCDYFSRMSCLASADYLEAYLKALDLKPEEILGEAESGESARLTTFGRSEHLRWCAFHFCMGYRPVTGEALERRIETYQKLAASGSAAGYRITKDAKQRIHACLIPWEELPALSEKVSEVTGKTTSYQQMDLDNVLALCEEMQKAQ